MFLLLLGGIPYNTIDVGKETNVRDSEQTFEIQNDIKMSVVDGTDDAVESIFLDDSNDRDDAGALQTSTSISNGCDNSNDTSSNSEFNFSNYT
jgi:hypothetical protein